MDKRYALRSTADNGSGAVWSTGSYWSSHVPNEDRLMTGQQVDEFAQHHLDAEIIDVIVYRAACNVWTHAFNKAISAIGTHPSTHADRQSARLQANEALEHAGYKNAVVL